MSQKYSHSCIKCSEKYESDDIDPYYCKKCEEEKKIIAKQVDSKIAVRPLKRKPKSDFQIYDEMCHIHKTAFVPIKSLGIKL